MRISSGYGVVVAPQTPTPPVTTSTLEDQAESLSKLIESTSKDTKLDCKIKDSQLGTLRTRLTQVQQMLGEARTRERTSAPAPRLQTIKPASASEATDADPSQRARVDRWA